MRLAVYDSTTWEPNRVSLQHGFFSVWVVGLLRNADIDNVDLRMPPARRQACNDST